MNENRLTDYLHHMEQAATDACGFVEGYAWHAQPHRPRLLRHQP